MIHAVGYLEPAGEIRRLAFPEDGVIVRVHVKLGDIVRAGEALAELDSALAQRELMVAEARHVAAVAELKQLKAGIHPDLIAAAEAQLGAAAEELRHRELEQKRFEALADKQGVSRSEADEAVHLLRTAETRWQLAQSRLEALRNQPRVEEVALAETRVSAAEAEVALAQERLVRRTLRAPVGGKVLDVLHREGESFSTMAEDVAVLFAPEGPTLVRMEVDELDATRVSVGMIAEARPKGSKSHASGVIHSIKPVMGRKSVFNRRATERMDLQVVEVWAQLDHPVDWKLGMEVDVMIVTDCDPP
jgi:multidrug resistance efflux pump